MKSEFRLEALAIRHGRRTSDSVKAGILPLFACLAACQTVAADSAQVRTIGLGETATFDGLNVRALQVAEDSRCPIGVQCIQAGTVRLEVEVAGDRPALSLGAPIAAGRHWLSLTRACPYPVDGTPIRPADYRFTLQLSASDAPPLVDSEGCGGQEH